MEFQNTLEQASYSTFADIGFLFLAIFPLAVLLVVIITGFEFFKKSKSPSLKKALVLLFLTISIPSLWFSVSMVDNWLKVVISEAPYEVEQRTDERLKENIMQKYHVDEVHLDGVDTINDKTYYVESQESDEQAIMVTVNGEDYIFGLTQNEETFEPTLSNPPRQGGSSDSLGADDLLKDKTN